MLSYLTVRQVKAADKPYALADFDGLFLNISPNGDLRRGTSASLGRASVSAQTKIYMNKATSDSSLKWEIAKLVKIWGNAASKSLA